jgi:hypothetical protein
MPDILADQLAELLAAALVPIAGYLVALVRRWHINTTVLRAVVRGAGAAYMSLLQDKAGASAPAVERALDVGAAYVQQRVPASLPKAGFGNTDSVRQAVRAQLGTLLAADPSIKVGG